MPTASAVLLCQRSRRSRNSFQANVQMMAAITGCTVANAVVKNSLD